MIGLSASPTGTGWAAVAHLPYLLKSSKYSITALCNSSVESAQKAIAAFNLPSNTKAYGRPEDLAADPEVDLVVCNTRVDKHAELINPMISAGKDVFCEWPLGKNLTQARDTATAAKAKGVRTMTGLQARVSPVVLKVKELVEQGRIGNVLSTTWVGPAVNGGEEEYKSFAYTVNREIGAGLLNIHFGHSKSNCVIGFLLRSVDTFIAMDYILYALGELESFNSLLAVQRRTTNIIDPCNE